MTTVQAAAAGSFVPAPVSRSAPPVQDFGGDTFMRLLLTELQHQDPLDPMKSENLIQQTALMSMVQQLKTLNENVTASGLTQQLAAGAGLIGKTITAGSPNGEPISGVVTGVSVQGGKVMLNLGAVSVPLSSVLTVREGTHGN